MNNSRQVLGYNTLKPLQPASPTFDCGYAVVVQASCSVPRRYGKLEMPVMTLNQALAIINSRRESDGTGIHYLVCGFEPLHLATLLRAHLLERLPQQKSVEVHHGVYGDFLGNIQSAAQSRAISSALALEWSDIDPRLGLRSSGGWSSEAKADIPGSCLTRYAHIEAAIEKLAARMPVAIAPPSLPLPPIGNTVRAQSSVLELELEQQLDRKSVV